MNLNFLDFEQPIAELLSLVFLFNIVEQSHAIHLSVGLLEIKF